MQCGCGHDFVAGSEWLGVWQEGHEACPVCGVTCEQNEAPRVIVDPGDLALRDELVTPLHWYHTSTQPDWPTKDFDPAANWGPDEIARMGGQDIVDNWVAGQRLKALHVGTYEAAIHNMLRRMGNQGDREDQFYLYRVRLHPGVKVQAGWIRDPGGAWGDVPLLDVCPPGVDVARYLNQHEDVGRLSLALARGAIASVQRLAVPQPGGGNDDWERDALEAITLADATAPDLTCEPSKLDQFRAQPPDIRRRRAAAAALFALSEQLPLDIQFRFSDAVAISVDDDPVLWARRVSELSALILEPSIVLAALDEQSLRPVGARYLASESALKHARPNSKT